jgi:hypothetical protein
VQVFFISGVTASGHQNMRQASLSLTDNEKQNKNTSMAW